MRVGMSIYVTAAFQFAGIIIFSFAIATSSYVITLTTSDLCRIGFPGLGITWGYIVVVYLISIPLMGRVVPHVYSQEKAEGFFRYAQARVRTYVESIAFYDGEMDEERNANSSFKNALKRSVIVLRKQFFLNCTYSDMRFCRNIVADDDTI
jgi:ABC-type uncharacterized transport system fused permease/ATPase subunit